MMTEKNFFEQFSYHWWDPEGPLRALHDINPARLNFIKQQAQLTTERTQCIIDVGCGGGILTESLVPYAKAIVGIDTSPTALKAAEQHAIQQGLDEQQLSYHSIDIQEIAARQLSVFDVVTCLELLEHVNDPDVIIADCARLCKPGGYVFFSTLHRNPKAFFYAILGGEYLCNLIPKGTHHYAKFIKPAELDRLARSHGLMLTRIAGIHYNPFTYQAKCVEDVQVNYIAAYRKLGSPTS